MWTDPSSRRWTAQNIRSAILNLSRWSSAAFAAAFLYELDQALGNWIFERPSLADFAILPFVRQFAFVDKPWFDAQPWPKLHTWLSRFLSSDRFERVMRKYPQWRLGDEPVYFP